MDADQVLEVLHQAGLNILLTPEQGLRVSPASALNAELRDLIRASKAVLIDLLERMRTADDAADQWRVSVAPGTSPVALARLRAASLALDNMQWAAQQGPSILASNEVSRKVSTEMKVSGGKVTDKDSGENEVRRALRTKTQDFDRWCWPHSLAMNGAEIDTFTARLLRFTDKGLARTDGEVLADKLVLRDRESDDRRVCLECKHFAGHGAGSWRCGNWQSAGIALRARDAQFPADLVVQLQRCDGFTAAAPNAKANATPDSTATTPF